MPVYLQNRRANYDYTFEEDYEAGIKLTGQEVKAIKEGKGNLAGAHIVFKGTEPFLINFNLPPYSRAGPIDNYDPARSRKLLLHEKEIKSLQGKVERQGYTLIPLKVYSQRNLIKVKIGLGRGKKKAEKKEYLIKKQLEKRGQ